MLKIVETMSGNEYGARYEIEISKDGKRIDGFRASPLQECPEDASLERDLYYAYKAVDFFKLGYEAAKNNEEVVFEVIEENEDD